eukprot:8766826-Pyramimonas_sp.AAC.1
MATLLESDSWQPAKVDKYFQQTVDWLRRAAEVARHLDDPAGGASYLPPACAATRLYRALQLLYPALDAPVPGGGGRRRAGFGHARRAIGSARSRRSDGSPRCGRVQGRDLPAAAAPTGVAVGAVRKLQRERGVHRGEPSDLRERADPTACTFVIHTRYSRRARVGAVSAACTLGRSPEL